MANHSRPFRRFLGKTGNSRVLWTASRLQRPPLAAVDQALSRNCRAGHIRKIARGLYDASRDHVLLGRLAPDRSVLLDAVSRRDAPKIFSIGAHAANALGLSDQVPMRAFYLTTGRSRKIKVGGTDIQLKRAPARYLAVKNHTSGIVIQALRWLGRKNVDADAIATLRRNLPSDDRAALLQDAHLAPAWIADIFSSPRQRPRPLN